MLLKILLVTAHPDDEAMFFAPTITSLQQKGATVCLLCLSTGDAEGLGGVRSAELAEACAELKIAPSNLTIVDDPRLQDGLQERWDDAVVAQHVEAAVQALAPSLLITFDDYGVSGHPNHRAVHRGVVSFLRHHRSQRQRQQQGTPGLEAQVLDGTVTHVSFKPSSTWRAMRAHRSQLVWFRRLFIVFSRYFDASVQGIESSRVANNIELERQK